MKNILALLVFALLLSALSQIKTTRAESTKVELSVAVVARTPQDTINDFNFNQLQPQGQVKGARTSKKDSPKSFFTKFWAKITHVYKIV